MSEGDGNAAVTPTEAANWSVSRKKEIDDKGDSGEQRPENTGQHRSGLVVGPRVASPSPVHGSAASQQHADYKPSRCRDRMEKT